MVEINQFYVDGTTDVPVPSVITPNNGHLPSLREAILYAEDHAGPNDNYQINLALGTYTMDLKTFQPGLGNTEYTANDRNYGDFDITSSMTINGNGAVIQGDGLGRVLQISGNIHVTLNDLTIENGASASLFTQQDGGSA